MSEPMVLVLEDGFTVLGERGGQATQSTGEVVINTCMTGYQEVLSDPSYAGQMVVMTYPLIGNYGVTPDFLESGRPWVRALITRQLSSFQHHWRSHQSLDDEWILIDPREEWTVDASSFRSRGKNTPFQGRRLRGRVIMTICRGQVVTERVMQHV